MPLHHLFNDHADHVRGKVAGIYALLLLFNAGAWLWAIAAFHRFPVLLGTAFLAYSFGLRHAVDADHIAAIDNVTRKLMQEGKRPVAVGFMFSLGHSTIVILGSVLIAAAALGLQHRLDHFRSIGGVIGTTVSAIFLLAIAIANLVILRSVYGTFTRVRRGEPYVDEDLDLLLSGRGFLARIFRPVFAMIRRSWHMYPLGVLFGLGFDTATEIGLLGISAAEASRGLSFCASPLRHKMLNEFLSSATPTRELSRSVHEASSLRVARNHRRQVSPVRAWCRTGRLPLSPRCVDPGQSALRVRARLRAK